MLVCAFFMFCLMSLSSACLLASGGFVASFLFFFVCRFSGDIMLSGSGFVMDKLSWLLVTLTLWMMVVIFFMSALKKQTGLFIVLSSLCFFLVMSFSLGSLLGFYVFFEVALVPLFFLVVGWGYQVERVQAAFYLFIYTLFGSLPLLFFLLFFLKTSQLYWTGFWCMVGVDFSSIKGLLAVLVSISLLIKLPCYGVHLWLPKAHVEAPVMGSMVLAAILLKLSVYGYYRVFPLMLDIFWSYSFFLSSFLLWGAVMAAFVALRQTDMKSLVAFSSISHMGVLMSGVFTLMSMSTQGAVIIMLAHGFCSSALFFLVNLQFDQLGSRQILLSTGQNGIFLGSGVWWFLFLIMNFSAPPFLSLFGEVLVMVQLAFCSWIFMVVVMLVSFLVATFCMFLFSSVAHGKVNKFFSFFSSSDFSNLVLFYHFLPSLACIFIFSLMFV